MLQQAVPLNMRHSRLFEELQRDARRGSRGLWSPGTCNGEV